MKTKWDTPVKTTKAAQDAAKAALAEPTERVNFVIPCSTALEFKRACANAAIEKGKRVTMTSVVKDGIDKFIKKYN